MQVINYTLQNHEHSVLSIVLDGKVSPGEYSEPLELHAIALMGVRVGASIEGVIEKAKLLPFGVDTICMGAQIRTIIGVLAKEDFIKIATRSDQRILADLVEQLPHLLES